MLVVIPVGQTDDLNPPNRQTAGGENATEWSGIDPDGAHATAEAVAWAGSIPETSVTPGHPSVRSVPLKKLGDRTIWEGVCYNLKVRRDECQGNIVFLGQPKEKNNVPLRIEVRRVIDTAGAWMARFIGVMLIAEAGDDLPGVTEGIEDVIDWMMRLGGAGFLAQAPGFAMNQINRDVDEDGNSAYLKQELWHDPVGYGTTIIRSNSSAWGTFAGDSFNVSRRSHTHDGLGLHPDP